MKLLLFFFKLPIQLKVGLLLLAWSSLEVSAQPVYPEGIKYRTGFLNNYYTNPDSAVFYARKLASDPKHMSFLRQAVHDDMAYFLADEIKGKFREQGLKENDPDWKKKYEEFLKPIYNTAYQMSTDADAIVSNTARPLHLWANVHRIQQMMDDANELKKSDVAVRGRVADKAGKNINPPGNEAQIARMKAYAQQFLKERTIQKDPYENRMATYALLIYRDIVKHKSMEKEANDLLMLTMQLTLNPSENIDVYTASAEEKKRRAWNRYAYSCANYLKAVSLSQAGKHKLAAPYYKTSADYSPDLTDLTKIGEISLETVLFGNRKVDFFQLAYLDYLEKYGDKVEMLSALTQLAVRNPVDHKAPLQTYYATNFTQQETFSSYWRKAINKGLIKAPVLQMKKIDGSDYSSVERAGKWVLVDFWGTWCGPCRAEHPELEKLYVGHKAMPSSNLEIITIACNDTEEKVLSYMDEFKYTYPVAMNDQKMTKAYNVQGYPTKALITPEGNYMFIPFGSDWVKFIERYME